MAARRRRGNRSQEIERLHTLVDQPREQTDYAISLLQPKRGRQVIQSALQILIERPDEGARNALVSLYYDFARQDGMNDVGAYQRTMIIQALRPFVHREDLELLVDAVTTYEFPAPAFTEDAAPLRAASLIALAEVDDELGRLFAAGLLGDMYAQPMSGEPAMTAVKVLATFADVQPLYQYVMRSANNMLPEVTAECLRQLQTCPEELIPPLVARLRKSEDPLILSGLFDLLIEHHTGPHDIDYFATFLSTTTNQELYRYVVMTMVASGKPVLRQLLANLAQYEQMPFRIETLLDALELHAKPEDEALLDALRQRLQAR